MSCHILSKLFQQGEKAKALIEALTGNCESSRRSIDNSNSKCSTYILYQPGPGLSGGCWALPRPEDGGSRFLESEHESVKVGKTIKVSASDNRSVASM